MQSFSASETAVWYIGIASVCACVCVCVCVCVCARACVCGVCVIKIVGVYFQVLIQMYMLIQS